MQSKLLAILVVFLAGSSLSAQQSIRGFPQALTGAHRARENAVVEILDSSRVREYIRRMAAEPHHAGGKGSRDVAEYAMRLFESWGYDAQIAEFEALLPWPTKRRLEVLGPRPYVARLEESVLTEDPDSGDANQLPIYNAYSGSGDVSAPVVYVNYGRPEDYDELARMGVEVKGKVALARYGATWRGIKARTAQERGAVGCLIYSDPRDDGYFQGDAYPKGPTRPKQGAQRGSVLDMPLYPGDPLSPGWALEKGSRRLPVAEAQTVLKIPVLPISYEDAQPILEQMDGPLAPEAWRGALPLTYHAGPGPASVRLAVDFDWSVKPVFNVVARMEGAEFPDQWVLYGNHHDAWVNGAHDPASGAAALLESARALGELRRKGWRPRRTIIFLLWDAEEFGLVGSTEWVEKHAEDLRAKGVAYLNSDSNARGTVGAGGTPSLEKFFEELLRDIPDPGTGKNVLEAAQSRPRRGMAEPPEQFQFGPLGAGSDYVAFVQVAGMASANVGFSSPSAWGVYHSIYDSFTWYERFADPGFTYGKVLAHLKAVALLRLADAPLLPFEFTRYAAAFQSNQQQLEKLARGRKLSLDWSAFNSASNKLASSAAAFNQAYLELLPQTGNLAPERLAAINRLVYQTERSLLSAGPLPRREWYKHRYFSPGYATGYSAKTLPGVREAIERSDATEAKQELEKLERVVQNLKNAVDAAAQAMRAARP